MIKEVQVTERHEEWSEGTRLMGGPRHWRAAREEDWKARGQGSFLKSPQRSLDGRESVLKCPRKELKV